MQKFCDKNHGYRLEQFLIGTLIHIDKLDNNICIPYIYIYIHIDRVYVLLTGFL